MAEAVSWAGVQRSALDGAHTAWFGDLPPALIDAARRDTAGRRLLARRLVEVAPQIFASFPAVVPSALAASAWLLNERYSLDEHALDLGALAFAPLLRLIISRADSVRLRRVLGEQRHARTLAEADRIPTPPAAAADALAVALSADESLRALFLEHGRVEWSTHAGLVHPAAIAWLRLRHAPGVIGNEGSGWLPESQTARALVATTTEAPGGSESRHH